jgi:hypothetical protein
VLGPRERISPSSAIFAVLGDLHLDPRHRPADGAEAGRAAGVDRDHRRRFGQSVALVDRQSRAPEEFRHVAPQRGSAGDREDEAAAQALADLGEDEAVGEPDAEADRLEGESLRQRLAADSEGPLEDLRLQPAAGSGVLEHAGHDLLVHARNGDENVRSHFQQIRRDGLHRFGVGDRDALEEVAVVDQTLERMRQRQEGERGELAVEAENFAAGDRIRDQIVVRQHDPLGVAGGAAGVDEGREILGSDRRGSLLEPGPIGRRAQGHERLEALPPGRCVPLGGADADAHDPLHFRHLSAYGQEPLQALAPLNEEDPRAAVAGDVGGPFGKQRRIDRNQGRADAQGGEIDRRPVGAVLGHERHPVARADADLDQSPGDLADLADELGGRNRLVAASHLVQQALSPVVTRDDEKELGKRPDGHSFGS